MLGGDILVKDTAILIEDKINSAVNKLQDKAHELRDQAKDGISNLSKKAVLLALTPIGKAEEMYDSVLTIPSVINKHLAGFNERVKSYHYEKTQERWAEKVVAARSAMSEATEQYVLATKSLENRKQMQSVRNLIESLK